LVSIPPWFDFASGKPKVSGYSAPCFNPTLVRFCRYRLCCVVCCCHRFQSHLGSILPKLSSTLTRHTILVSIPPWFDFAHPLCAAAFLDTQVSIPPWFDFAEEDLPLLDTVGRFQSHLGSILPHHATRARWQTDSFQSHLGSILPSAALAGDAGILLFQSHLGSILPGGGAGGECLTIQVSIPPWFDFALPQSQEACICTFVSIPPWFDFATVGRGDVLPDML